MSYRACSVEGCTDPHNAKGLCCVHYSRWRRTGDPLGRRPAQTPDAKIAYLRGLEGIPADGPTLDQRRRWQAQEAS